MNDLKFLKNIQRLFIRLQETIIPSLIYPSLLNFRVVVGTGKHDSKIDKILFKNKRFIR
jgi:hypothetical protein